MREAERNLGREAPLEEEFSIRLGELHSYNLCAAAEIYLHDNIESGEVILVNEIFLMKRKGWIAGVSLEDKQVEGGEIKTGVWYILKGEKIGDSLANWAKLEKAIDNGEKTINFPKLVVDEDRPVRDHLRRYNMTKDGYLQMVYDAASQIKKETTS